MSATVLMRDSWCWGAHTSKSIGTQIVGNDGGHSDSIYQTQQCQIIQWIVATHLLALTLVRAVFPEVQGVHLLGCLKWEVRPIHHHHHQGGSLVCNRETLRGYVMFPLWVLLLMIPCPQQKGMEPFEEEGACDKHVWSRGRKFGGQAQQWSSIGHVWSKQKQMLWDWKSCFS